MSKSKWMPRPEVQEAAGGKTEAALRQMVWRKQIPFRKIGGRIVFLREEIEQWVQNAPGVRLEDLQKKGA